MVETHRPGQSPQKVYSVMDPRGTITRQVQADGTTVQASREYDAFGTILSGSASGTWLGRFGYQGQAWMEILSQDGLQRLLLSPTRLYDPATGRFLQNEPLLSRRTLAQYLYANQNPVSFVDPLGLECKSKNTQKEYSAPVGAQYDDDPSGINPEQIPQLLNYLNTLGPKSPRSSACQPNVCVGGYGLLEIRRVNRLERDI